MSPCSLPYLEKTEVCCFVRGRCHLCDPLDLLGVWMHALCAVLCPEECDSLSSKFQFLCCLVPIPPSGIRLRG